MKSEILILAHRGARKYAPENTLPAFEKAIEIGADGVEFDLMATSDNKLVVVHDNNLKKLAGIDVNVSKSEFDFLRTLDVGRHFSEFFTSEKIPTFEEVKNSFLSASLNRKFVINIELKEQKGQNKGFVEKAAEEITAFSKQAPSNFEIVVSSFSPSILKKFSKAAPDIKISFLCRPRAFSFLHAAFFASILHVWGINPHVAILNKRFSRLALLSDWKLIAWTANSIKQLENAAKLNVYAVITDDILLAKEVLR